MTRLHTPLCDFLGCDVPVLLAGMGGVARWELAAAVANAGGYAMLGMVREDPDLIASEITALRAATNRGFAVNVIPSATEAGLLDRQIGRCLDLGVTDFTFFWDVVPAAVARVKAAGCKVLHQVGTVEAARQAEERIGQRGRQRPLLRRGGRVEVHGVQHGVRKHAELSAADGFCRDTHIDIRREAQRQTRPRRWSKLSARGCPN